MDPDKQAARGLADLEAYLYREAHLGAARRRVAAFTSRADGLTREQCGDIERWYLDEQRHVARMVTQHIAETISTAEEHHRVRFRRWLRGTLTAMTLITVAMAVCAVVAVGIVA